MEKRKLIAFQESTDRGVVNACYHFLVPTEWNFETKRKEYEEYMAKIRARDKYLPMAYDKSFKQWLIDRGAIATREQDIETWED